jgi:hypothetical protein
MSLRVGLGASISAVLALAGCGASDVAIVENGDAGSSGRAFAPPSTASVDKVDLLFVIDDAPGMLDAQTELARRLPALLASLSARAPTRSGGDATLRLASVNVGFVSSSLGGHGTSACAGSHGDDRGHLLPRAGETASGGFTVDAAGAPQPASCPAPIASSALSWAFNPDRMARFTGVASSPALQAASTCVLLSAQDDGCAYPAPLEAAYHFLVDPAPYASADAACTKSPAGDDCGSSKITPSGLDEELLTQRRAFLRPDSLLVVTLIGNHDDASLLPAGLDWLPLANGDGKMPHAWSGCAGVPDDLEPQTSADYSRLWTDYRCLSCLQKAPDGTSDPSCALPWPAPSPNADVDARAVRGLRQTERFGYNFLWGRQRYVDAFTAATVVDSYGKVAANPVYAGGFRTKDLVLVAGILGVPKSLAPALAADGSARTLSEAEWQKIVSADPAQRDPHLIASIAPRAGVPRYAGDRAVDADNGGDRDVPFGGDLQYACLGPRAASVTTAKTVDCSAADADQRNPLCVKGASGAIVQPYFKAYPTLRQLRVLHTLSSAKVPTALASICDDSYAPAIAAIAARMRAALVEPCSRLILDVDTKTGAVACLRLEVFDGDRPHGAARCEDLGGGKPGYCTPGAAPCRLAGGTFPPQTAEAAAGQTTVALTLVDPATGGTRTERVQALASGGNVYATATNGVKHLVCETLQLAGNPAVDAATQSGCLHDASFALPASLAGGWCYATDAALIGARCSAKGAYGTMREYGDPGVTLEAQSQYYCRQ